MLEDIGDKWASQVWKALLSLKQSLLKSPQKWFSKESRESHSKMSLVNCWGKGSSYTLSPSIDRQAADRDSSEPERKAGPSMTAGIWWKPEETWISPERHIIQKERAEKETEKRTFVSFKVNFWVVYKHWFNYIIFHSFLITLQSGFYHSISTKSTSNISLASFLWTQHFFSPHYYLTFECTM